MEDERWVDLEGYDAPYRLSSEGIVTRLGHFNAGGVWLKPRTMAVILPAAHPRSPYVQLRRGGKAVPTRISRLVVEHFIGEPSFPYWVDYVDDNPRNNAARNLVIRSMVEKAQAMGSAMAKPVEVIDGAQVTRYPSGVALAKDRGKGVANALYSGKEHRVGQGRRDGAGLRVRRPQK